MVQVLISRQVLEQLIKVLLEARTILRVEVISQAAAAAVQVL